MKKLWVLAYNNSYCERKIVLFSVGFIVKVHCFTFCLSSNDVIPCFTKSYHYDGKGSVGHMRKKFSCINIVSVNCRIPSLVVSYASVFNGISQ